MPHSEQWDGSLSNSAMSLRVMHSSRPVQLYSDSFLSHSSNINFDPEQTLRCEWNEAQKASQYEPSEHSQGIVSINANDLDVIAKDKVRITRKSRSDIDLISGHTYILNEKGNVCDYITKMHISKEVIRSDGERLIKALIAHVHHVMLHECNFREQVIPALDSDVEQNTFTSSCAFTASIISAKLKNSAHSRNLSSSICSTSDGFRTMIDTAIPRCIFHTSNNYSITKKLVVFIGSSRGLSCGIWSRSVLLNDGLSYGSMIPYFREAMKEKYGIVVMNPNMNTQMMVDKDGKPVKTAIKGSSTQEEHVDHVWNNYIFPSSAHTVHFIAFGYGGELVTQLIQKYQCQLKNRLGNVAIIESTHEFDYAWGDTFQQFYSEHAVCWKRSIKPFKTGTDAECIESQPVKYGNTGASDETVILHTPESKRYGCLCLTTGIATEERSNPAYTTNFVKDAVFQFLRASNAYEFERQCARSLQRTRCYEQLCLPSGSVRGPLKVDTARSSAGFPISVLVSKIHSPRLEKVSIEDFELLQLIGRGAFGKVYMVRRKLPQVIAVNDTLLQKTMERKQKKNTFHSRANRKQHITNPPLKGNIYAMKVIEKANVFKNRQVEHTKAERRILQKIDHPFIVKLKYAFQTTRELYFVMKYYRGGALSAHLERAHTFNETTARFYTAQIVLAISHLHTYNIVYRDLKPDNILMDDDGYLALTDFGLSQDKYDPKGGLLSFCGTPQYIAPELIKRVIYGKSVDYWSLGILLFEMLVGSTPFYHHSRTQIFKNILKLPLIIPERISEPAKSLIRGLLARDPTKRLGSGICGVQEIKEHIFFESVNWENLYKRRLKASFQPKRKEMAVDSNNARCLKQGSIDTSAIELDTRHVFYDFSYVDSVCGGIV